MASDSLCARCKGGLEDALHVVRDCCHAKEVWTCIITASYIPCFSSLNLNEWILQNRLFRGKAQWGSEWPELVATVLESLEVEESRSSSRKGCGCRLGWLTSSKLWRKQQQLGLLASMRLWNRKGDDVFVCFFFGVIRRLC